MQEEMHRSEQTLLDKSLFALQQKTGIAGQSTSRQWAGYTNYVPDGFIDLHIDGRRLHYAVECKSNVDRKILADQVRRQFGDQQEHGLLLAPYISREIAEYCRSIGLQFIDTHGNAYLRNEGVIIYITGERSAQGGQPARTPKGITSLVGMRVAFVLLCKPELISLPFKDLAELAGVSVGSANNALEDLERRGYLIHKGSSARRKLLEPRRLLNEWVVNYDSALKPKLYCRRFTAAINTPSWWENEMLENYAASWSGEVAADRLTRQLAPATQTLFVAPEAMADTIKKMVIKHRLKPKPDGEIEILERFWSPTLEERPGIAPAVLIYADLLATLDPRAAEVAENLKKKWIDHAFDQT